MPILEQNIKRILNNKQISIYKLSKMLDYPESHLYKMIKMQVPFPDHIMEKILPILEVSKEEFESWILAEKYSKEILKLAVTVKTNFSHKGKSILTVEIDELLENKKMSRTNIAKQINYSQSGLNRMITGQISMSKSVLERLSYALELSRDEITSWILADKNSLQVLEMTLSC